LVLVSVAGMQVEHGWVEVVVTVNTAWLCVVVITDWLCVVIIVVGLVGVVVGTKIVAVVVPVGCEDVIGTTMVEACGQGVP
jgi:hypothetical protein